MHFSRILGQKTFCHEMLWRNQNCPTKKCTLRQDQMQINSVEILWIMLYSAGKDFIFIPYLNIYYKNYILILFIYLYIYFTYIYIYYIRYLVYKFLHILAFSFIRLKDVLCMHITTFLTNLEYTGKSLTQYICQNLWTHKHINLT